MEHESQQHKHHHNHLQHNHPHHNLPIEYVDPGEECNEISNRIYVNKCIVDTSHYDDYLTFDGENLNDRIFVNKSLVDNVCCEQKNPEPTENPTNKVYLTGSFFSHICNDGKDADQSNHVYYDKVYVNTSFFKNLCCGNHNSEGEEPKPSPDPSDNIMVICVPEDDAKEPKKCGDKKYKKHGKLSLKQNLQIHLDKFISKVIENEAAKNKSCNDAQSSSSAATSQKQSQTPSKSGSTVQPPPTSGGTVSPIIESSDNEKKEPVQPRFSPEPSTNKVKKQPSSSKQGSSASCKSKKKKSSPGNQDKASSGDGSLCCHSLDQSCSSNQSQKTSEGDKSISNHTEPSGSVGSTRDLDKDNPVAKEPVSFKQELTNCMCHDIYKTHKRHQHIHQHLRHSDNTHQSQCEQTLPKSNHSTQVIHLNEGKWQEALVQREQQAYTNPFKFPHTVESQMKFYYDLITDPKYNICAKRRNCDGEIESSPSICRCDAPPPTPPISETSCSCEEVAGYESSRKSRKCSSAIKSVCVIA